MTNKEFINKVKTKLISEEEIRTYLLSLEKKEFLNLICINSEKQPTPDKDIEQMIENHLPIIEEILVEITEEEKLKYIPIISKDFSIIKEFLFNTLNIENITKLFLDNKEEYKRYIVSYIKDPRESKEKDELICMILSDKELYKYFTEEERSIFKTILSDAVIILDERYNLCNVTYDDLKQELARYLGNIEYKKSSSINKGIHTKISSKVIYHIYNEVNKGFERIETPLLTEEDIIKYLELPFEKSVLFLNECLSLTEEDIIKLLIKYYKEHTNVIKNRSIEQLVEYVKDQNIPLVDSDYK